MKTLKTDVLILGTGLAGCSAALQIAKSGYNVIMVTPSDESKETATSLAQGGIVYKCPQDLQLLANDIINAGAAASDKGAVEIITRFGPEIIENVLMNELGVQFDRDESGKLHLTKEAAHSCRRILHIKDSTGRSIENAFIEKLKRFSNVSIMKMHTLIDILTKSHHMKNFSGEDSCIGAYILDNEKKKVITVLAKKTIIATGGVGQIFFRTVNPRFSRGDGIFAAQRAGAEIADIEYIQFHPTSLYHRDVPDFLISEAVRGEGGILKTRKGEPFMKKYDEKGSLAPRDVVTRGIFSEMLKSGDNYVLLDIASYMKPEKIKSHFETIYKKCLENGIDITKEPIPVSPSAHYICGGIKVDSYGRTNIKNLYAVGEASRTGVHGANRLASVSLLECLVWGTRAGKEISETISEERMIPENDVREWIYSDKIKSVDPALIRQDWMSIKSIMWNYVGIIRTTKRLERAVADLTYLQKRIDEFYHDACICDELVGLRNGVGVASLIAKAALANNESRGAHYIEENGNSL